MGLASGSVSKQNTTTTPLGGGGTFTGSPERNDSPDVMVSCYADVAGTLYFDFSNDVTSDNWRTFPTQGFVVSAGVHEFHSALKGPRYFRARFVNGADAQTTFQLYTYYGNYRQPSAPLNQPHSLDADAILTRPTFPWLDINRNLISGMFAVKKFGRNSAIGTGWTIVAPGGIYQQPSGTVSMEFVSSDAGDARDDTGAHEITVEGLDANWELQTVATPTHATNGTTAVAISGTWRRIFRAYVSKGGAYPAAGAGSHIGTITIRVAGAGATYTTIPVVSSLPVGQSLIGCYTIPTGYTGHIFLTSVSVDSGKTVDIGLFSRERADDTTSTYDGTRRVKSIFTGVAGPFNRTGANVPLKLTGPADITFMARGATTPVVAVEFEIFLVQE